MQVGMVSTFGVQCGLSTYSTYLGNALQDLKIDYNFIIKDNRKIIIQFIPGEDKIDPSRSSWGELDVRSIVQSVIR